VNGQNLIEWPAGASEGGEAVVERDKRLSAARLSPIRTRRARGQVVPKWIEWFFVVAAVVLIPWIIVLFTVSPEAGLVTKHSRLVWAGFDCFLLLGFAVTAYRIATRSPRGAITAAATGTMLFVDAWFDVLTSRRPVDQLAAVLMAVFAEIPCGLICFYVARRIIGVFEASIPVLRDAGFRMSGGRLVPPAEPPAGPAAARSEQVSER
jgi:hypothetical protein